MQPNTDEPTEKPASFFQTKAFTILMVLLASLAGYLLAPGDLAPGTYQNRVEITADGSVYSIEVPFEIGSVSSPVQTYQETSGGGTIEVQASPGYKNALGQKIAFKARLLDADGNPVQLSLEDAFSTLSNGDYQQVLPPIEREGDWLTFSMRIPYKAKIATGLMLAVAVLWLT